MLLLTICVAGGGIEFIVILESRINRGWNAILQKNQTLKNMEISYEKILHRPMGSKVKVIVTANVSQDGCDWDYRAETYEQDGWVDPVVRAKNQGREEKYIDYATPEEAFDIQNEFWQLLKPSIKTDQSV